VEEGELCSPESVAGGAGPSEGPVVVVSAAMDYKKLRDMVSHRVTFEYDSGSKIVGYVASCLPPSGAVQMLVLSKVQVIDGSKNVIARYDELPLVPNNLVGFRITEGPL